MIAIIRSISQVISGTSLWRNLVKQCARIWVATLCVIGLFPIRTNNLEIAPDPEAREDTPAPHIATDPTPIGKILMIGNTSETRRIGNTVRKQHAPDPDPAITEANIQAAKKEANVYLILGAHRLIAECLFISPEEAYIDLKFYSKGTLRDYAGSNRPNISDAQLARWAYLLAESVAYIHSKGVRHGDLRLDQWLLDDDLQPRLADFNGSGFDPQPMLGLDFTKATSIEVPSHCMPRDFDASDDDSTVASDIFALGSSLYELETGRRPFQEVEDHDIELRFREGVFPDVGHLVMGDVILGCWTRRYTSADQILSVLQP